MNPWIKWTVGLERKSEVRAIARQLQITPAEAAARCMMFWSWCDSETSNGSIRATEDDVDDEAGIRGFARAMQEENWLLPCGDGFQLGNWDRHNGKSAKARALAAERKAQERKARP